MRLEWSALAMEDRDGIFDYIEAESPRAAVVIDDRIASQVLLLLQYPESGRVGRVAGTREQIIGQTPYIVAYRFNDDTLRILRVVHGSQEWPEDMPD